MKKLVFITGGARSGKSEFAEHLCKNVAGKTAYIATSIPFDDGMKERVKRHQNSRPDSWKTYEIYKDIYKKIKDIDSKNEVVILDCATLLVNNLMFDRNIDYETCDIKIVNKVEDDILNEIQLLIDEINKSSLYFVIVSNEIGCGIVPDNRLSSIYRDIVGRVNKKIASQSDEVYMVVSSIPIKIKG